MADTTMQLAYRHGWKPKGDHPRTYRWEHPTHGVLRGSGLSGVQAPWVWRPRPDGHEYHYGSMAEALEEIHEANPTTEGS